MTDMTRRDLLRTGVAAAAGLIGRAPATGRAQSKEPIPIGALCPLTGAGGAYGPDMQKAIVAVAERITKAGGIHGRPIQIYPEDSQTNPEAAVRAARKLFDVNHVVAIMSTWASAVTLAVKPLAVKAGGVTIADNLIYEDKKPSYRSEITRVLATNPDLIMLEGYAPDSVVIAKELYRLSYKGAILGPAFSINAKFVEGAGAEVAEGIWAIDPAPSFDSPAYKQFAAAVPTADKNPYAPQAWDHMTLVGLALAAGRGEASGTVVKDNLRAISNPPGTVVTSYEEGARLLREGKKINYEGASGSCDFDAQGDILSRPFGVYQVRKGKIEQVTIINP